MRHRSHLLLEYIFLRQTNYAVFCSLCFTFLRAFSPFSRSLQWLHYDGRCLLYITDNAYHAVFWRLGFHNFLFIVIPVSVKLMISEVKRKLRSLFSNLENALCSMWDSFHCYALFFYIIFICFDDFIDRPMCHFERILT